MKAATIRAHIRWMIRRDMPEVLAIEQSSFPRPWTEEDFLRSLRQRSIVGLVAERGESVVGYVIYELSRHSLDVVNFAVDPAFRRLGVGGQMVDALKANVSQGGSRGRVSLCVREGNLPAHLFWRSQGFEAVAVLPGYYQDSKEDGYRFAWRRSG